MAKIRLAVLKAPPWRGYQGVEKYIDLLNALVSFQSLDYAIEHEYVFDGFVGENIKSGKLGMQIISEALEPHIEGFRPFTGQQATQFMHGALCDWMPQWDVAGIHRYIRCPNCDAMCQGVVYSDGCNMCEGEEGEFYQCDCIVSGGDEPMSLCLLHASDDAQARREATYFGYDDPSEDTFTNVDSEYIKDLMREYPRVKEVEGWKPQYISQFTFFQKFMDKSIEQDQTPKGQMTPFLASLLRDSRGSSSS